MGCSEEEIARDCQDDGSPLRLEEELEELRCVQELKIITPPSAELEVVAIRY